MLDIKPYIPEYDSPFTPTIPRPSTLSHEEDEFRESASPMEKFKDFELASQPLSEEMDNDKTQINTETGTRSKY